MKKLKPADWKPFCFQKDMIRCRPPYFDPTIVYIMFRMEYDSYENQSSQSSKHGIWMVGSCLGTLHRGTIQTESGVQDVLVKTWEYFFPYPCDSQCRQHTSRIHDMMNSTY